MFKQQIIGVINLSLPIIILYSLWPALFAHTAGILACSLMIGMYVWYLNRQQAQALANSLRFAPTPEYQAKFNVLINECRINPSDIAVRYAYTNEAIAMMVGNMIIVDPVLWNIQDPEALKVKQIFDDQINPMLTATQKLRLADFRNASTPAAERFIFKHELGHVARNFSQKKLFICFIIGAAAAMCGISAAMLVLPIHGLLAIVVGMLVGGISDLVYTYALNASWKLHEEKSADRFAARYSSPEEIVAAAQFFAKHQEIVNRLKEPGNLLALLPSEIISGHQNGFKRSAFLMQLAEKSNGKVCGY